MTTFPIQTTPLEPAYTLEELRQVRDAINAEPRPGAFELAADAIDSEWSTSWFARWSMEQTMPVDPNFVLTPDLVKELGDGIDPALWNEFSRSESLTHAYYIRENLRDVQESRRHLARAGVTGAALSIGAAIVDPGFLAGGALLELGTAGLGGAGVAATKASRLQGLIRGGILATATDVPIQAFISGQDPDQGAREVLFTLAGGVILGGGLGAAFPRSVIGRTRGDVPLRPVENPVPQRVRVEPRDLGPTIAQIDREISVRGDPEILGIRESIDRLTAEHNAGKWYDAGYSMGIDGEQLVVMPRDDAKEAAFIRGYNTGLGKRTDIGDRPWPDIREKPSPKSPLRDSLQQIATEAHPAQLVRAYAINPQAGALETFIPAQVADAAGLNPSESERFTGAAGRLQRDMEFEEVGLAMGAASQRAFLEPLQRIRDRLTPKGLAYFRDQVDPAAMRKRVDDALAALYDPDRDADIIEGFRAMEPDAALRLMDDLHRAAWNPPQAAGTKAFPRTARERAELAESAKGLDEGSEPPAPPPLNTRPTGPEDFDASWTIGGVDRIGEQGIDKVRLPTFTVQLGRVKGRLTRIFGAASLHDDIVRRSGAPLGDNAEEFGRRIIQGRMAVYNRETGSAFKRFAELRSKKPTGALRRDFDRLVTQAIREGWKGVDADVEAAAGTIARLQGEVVHRMKMHGVEGWDEIQADPGYILRAWNTPAVHAADAQHGGDLFNKLVRKAILQKTPDIDEKLLNRIVLGFTEEVRALDQVQNRARSAMLDGANADALADMLRRWGLPEQDIEQLLYRVAPGDPDAGKINRAKHRLLMDESASIEAPDGSLISLQQFLEDDASTLFSTYLRETTQAAASREVYRAVSLAIDPDGGVDIKTWDQLKGILIDDLRTAGHAESEISDIVRVAEMVDRHTRGLPMRDRVAGQDFFRRARQAGHVLYSGGFGMTQQIEWGGLVGEAGVRASIRQMPALGEIITAAAKGKPPPGFLARIESMTGIGADHVNSRYLEHFDYKDAFDDSFIRGSTADRALHAGSRIANIASLMTPTMVIQKRWSIMLATQTWLDIARSGKAPSAKRLALLDLNEAQGAAIADGIRKYAVTDAGKTVTDLDIDRWLREDPATAGRYIRALDRWGSRVIQSGDLGSMMPWTTSVFGRVVTQFRTFVLQAWEKQFLHRVQMNDPAGWVGAAATFLTSALVYTARTHVQAAGRADRDEFLRKRLSTAAVAGGAFRYAGFNAFMPDVLDTFLPQKYQLFNRGSGLSTDIFDIGTAPVPSMASNAAKAIGSLGTSLFDGRFTRDEWRPISRLVPWRNIIGIRNALDAFETRLPENE